jgi:hypothetical protein
MLTVVQPALVDVFLLLYRVVSVLSSNAFSLLVLDCHVLLVDSKRQISPSLCLSQHGQ